MKPYVKTNKNDARYAEAICEAVSRPTMRFVSIKTVEQADLQALHRSDMTTWVVPSLYGLFSWSTTWPARLSLSRSLAIAGRVI